MANAEVVYLGWYPDMYNQLNLYDSELGDRLVQVIGKQGRLSLINGYKKSFIGYKYHANGKVIEGVWHLLVQKISKPQAQHIFWRKK